MEMIDKICIDCGYSFKGNTVSYQMNCKICDNTWKKIVSLEKLIVLKKEKLDYHLEQINKISKRTISAEKEIKQLKEKMKG